MLKRLFAILFLVAGLPLAAAPMRNARSEQGASPSVQISAQVPSGLNPGSFPPDFALSSSQSCCTSGGTSRGPFKSLNASRLAYTSLFFRSSISTPGDDRLLTSSRISSVIKSSSDREAFEVWILRSVCVEALCDPC